MTANEKLKDALSHDRSLREHLASLLSGKGAHADWEAAFSDIPANIRGTRRDNLPHSLWQLLEHIRIAQWDILEFCRDPKHVSPKWPEGYWPADASPPNSAAWDSSIDSVSRDLAAMVALVQDSRNDLFARIPHGTGQTILREALLVADHNAYHVGQVLFLRRLLGAWK